jgi:hypothetical protein
MSSRRRTVSVCRARRRLVEHLLGLGLGVGKRGVRLLPRLAGEPVCFGARGGACLVGLGACRGDGALGLFLRGSQQTVGLFPHLRANPIRLLLHVSPEPGYLVVRFIPLRVRLIVRQLQDLGDPLADFLVRGPAAKSLLANGGKLTAELLGIVDCPGEALF